MTDWLLVASKEQLEAKMEKEIIIADDEYEIRCAILEDGVLNEICLSFFTPFIL